MNKKVIMIVAIPLMVVAFVAFVGIASSYFCDKDDGPIEETAEAIIAAQADRLLGVDEKTFQIDLTPDSKELGEVAMLKIQDEWCREHCKVKGNQNGN
jgi:hypothetical protein